MPLHLIRSPSSRALWETCIDRFLERAGRATGPQSHRAHLWLAHRSQRDAAFERAARRGLRGWLAPPVSFFSELPARFGIRERPIGLLTARLLVARLAAREGRRHGLGETGRERGPAQAHMLDAVFSELLPEGVGPRRLRDALDALPGDPFARRRNEWLVRTYAAYLRELGARERFDPRAVHARLAERIEGGGLPEAIGGAAALHVYGITSLRGRRRLFRALAEQAEVTVSIYLVLEPEPSEWERELPVEGVEVLPASWPRAGGGAAPGRDAAGTGGDGAAPAADHPVRVQPAPDALREAEWVAARVKRLLAETEVEPHEVAVVARSGRRDLRLAYRALTAAGVPTTARLRTPLAEVPALKALLALFHGAARRWDYRSLRQTLSSPYFDVDLDARILDYLQRQRRIQGLAEWTEWIARARDAAAAEDGWKLAREGVYADRAGEAVEGLAAFRKAVAPLEETRSEEGWIALTLEWLAGRRLDFRRRLCRPAAERYDIVRLDQRGVLRLEEMLREWKALLEEGVLGGAREPLPVADWHGRLRRLLEANELALTTPLKTGVQVLEAHEAALTPYRHTFLIHANDGEFPKAAHAASVFSDEERGRLAEAGLPLTSHEAALRRERALWRSVTVGDDVTVTYRTTDARGVPRLPSLMVPAHDPASELPRVLHAPAGEAAARRAAGGGDRAGRAVHEAARRQADAERLRRRRAGGDRAPFPALDPARLRHAVLGAYAEEVRTGALDPVLGGAGRPPSQRPHAWNGRVRDPVVLDWIAERFGDDCVWSASQLQAYARRPFDWFLDRVLRLGETEEAGEETSPLAFGSVAHAILERFWGERLEGPPAALEGPVADRFEAICDEVFREFEEDASAWLGLPSLWAVTREDVRERVREFLAGELVQLARSGDTPIAVELSFGGRYPGEPPPVALAGTDRAGRPARLLLRGRIDRIDRMRERSRGKTAAKSSAAPEAPLKVVDFKSGGIPSPRGYDDGALLQPALYMAAAAELGIGEPRVGVLRSIKHCTWNGAALRRDRLPGVLSLALSIPGRVRAGLFEAVQAASARLSDWQPGMEVARTEARLTEGSRFDEPEAPADA